jgi:hypothetical protein
MIFVLKLELDETEYLYRILVLVSLAKLIGFANETDFMG